MQGTFAADSAGGLAIPLMWDQLKNAASDFRKAAKKATNPVSRLQCKLQLL